MSDLESPSNFQVKENKYSNRSINMEMDFCGPDSHLGKVQYRIWNPNQISKSKKKTMKLYLNLKCQNRHV